MALLSADCLRATIVADRDGEPFSLDPRHTCSAECSFRRSGDTFVCEYTGDGHHCGLRCDSGVCGVCALTGKAVSATTLPPLTPAASTPAAVAAPIAAAAQTLSPEKVLSECRLAVGTLLTSKHRQRNAEVIKTYDRLRKYAEQRVRQHRTNVYTRSHPINVFHVAQDLCSIYETWSGSANVMPAAPCANVDPTRLEFIAHQCMRCYMFCGRQFLSDSVSTPRYLPKPTYIAIALMYIMRTGISVEGHCVVPKDAWLAKNLPSLTTLDEYGYRKNKYTCAERFIKVSIDAALEQTAPALLARHIFEHDGSLGGV